MNIFIVKREIASLQAFQPVAWLIKMGEEIIIFLRTHNLMVANRTDQGRIQKSILCFAEPPFPFLFIKAFVHHIPDMNHELSVGGVLKGLFHRIAP
ncbi:hypothetical protein D3C73_972500 [compost metagenome]